MIGIITSINQPSSGQDCSDPKRRFQRGAPPRRDLPVNRSLVVFGIALICAVTSSARPAAPNVKKETAASAVPSRLIDGASFKERIEVNGESLALRGAGTAYWLGFKVYSVALHMPEDAPSTAVLGNRTLRLTLHYHRKVRKADIVKSSERVLAKNPKNKMASLRQPLNAFNSVLEPYVKEGDRYVLDWRAGKGATFYFNGKLKGVGKDRDFARAYFGIWLSPYPINEELRSQLLNLNAAATRKK